MSSSNQTYLADQAGDSATDLTSLRDQGNGSTHTADADLFGDAATDDGHAGNGGLFTNGQTADEQELEVDVCCSLLAQSDLACEFRLMQCSSCVIGSFRE